MWTLSARRVKSVAAAAERAERARRHSCALLPQLLQLHLPVLAAEVLPGEDALQRRGHPRLRHLERWQAYVV